MTRTDLRSRTRKQLDSLARRRRIPGRHSMNKEELIDALLARRPRGCKKGRPSQGRGKPAASQTKNSGRRVLKAATADGGETAAVRDRLVAEALDSQWIVVRWALTRRVLQRAQAALGLEWHHAVPVIRVLDVSADDTTTAPRAWVRDIEIHTDVDRWYIPVEGAPRSVTFEIGYRPPTGRFFALARSNRVRIPRSGPDRNLDSNRSRTLDAPEGNGRASGRLSRRTSSRRGNRNDRTKTQVRSPQLGQTRSNNGSGAGESFALRVNAELIVHGTTHPDAELTLFGERVPLNKDGSFSCRVALPEGRQVIPAVAVTPCGKEQRTIVLGVERNTKELEPQRLDELPL